MSAKEKHKTHEAVPGEKPSQGKNTFMLFLRAAMTTDETNVDLNTDARLLFDAIRKGKSHMIRFILDASPIDLANSTDIKGKTPLMVSCQIKEESRRSLAVRLLLTNGADVNFLDDDGRTVLSHACEMRCNDVVDMLVKHGSIDPDIPDNKGNTPLMYCSMVGNDVATDILLRHFRRLGLNVEAQNEDGFNALLLAAKYGNIACAKFLVEGRAALTHRDKINGLNAQEWLKKNGYSVEDITPLATRLRNRAKLLKALNIARLSIPNKIRAELEYDDEDENANNTKLTLPLPTETPIMGQPGVCDPDKRLNSLYLPRQFRLSENLCNEDLPPGLGYDLNADGLGVLDYPDLSVLHLQGSSSKKPTTMNFKTCCRDNVKPCGIRCRGSIETTAELPRWKPHFSMDHISFETQDDLDEVLFGKKDSGPNTKTF